MTANETVQQARLAAWETYQAPGNGMVARRIDGGRTALFAFRGSFLAADWGRNSEVSMAVLGTAPDLLPWQAMDSSARVHAGFLARLRETLSAAAPQNLREQVFAVHSDPTVQRVVFAGHSLGGAVALLAYVWARANPGRDQQEVECVTFGAPMVGDKKLSQEIARLGWGANITNIVTRHDIVPRILLAAWDGGRIVGLGAFLIACSGLMTSEERELQKQLPAEQGGLPGLYRKVKQACVKSAMGVRGAVSGTRPMLGAFQHAAVELVKGYPDTSNYRPFGRFFFVFGEKMVLEEDADLSFRLLYLTMMQHSNSPEYGGAADYIRDHMVYPYLAEFDVSRPASESARAAQAFAPTIESFFILEALAQLDDHMRQLLQKQQTSRTAELTDQKKAADDALVVVADYGDSAAERYEKYRYTCPRTAEEKNVEAARQTAKRFWQKAHGYYSAAELPQDFLSGHWLAQANNYRLLCEPIDIANYYRPWAADKEAIRFDPANGPYLREFADPTRNNRPIQYTWIEQAWRKAHPDDAVKSSVSFAEEEEAAISRGEYRPYGCI